MIANQIANRLGAILIAEPFDAFVEGVKQIIFQRNAESR
jgi:hypothetical protein